MNSIANELITRGWHQGSFEDSEGRVCLAAAVSYAYTDGQFYAAGVPVEVYRTVERCFPPGYHGNIPHFNDIASFDDVLRVAKLADELLEGYDPS